MGYDTFYIEGNILDMANEQDVVEFIKGNEERFISWKSYINQRVFMRGSYEKFADKTGFSKNTIKSWCKEGIMPKSRDMFIKLAFGLGMDVNQTNELLTKYGHYSELYAKDLYDAITIYIINRRMSDINNEQYSYDKLSQWFEKYKEICAGHIVDNKNYDSEKYKTIGVVKTLNEIKADHDFEKFIYEHKDIFLTTNSQLLLFLEQFINMRIMDLNRETDAEGKNKYSWHKIVIESGLDQSFDKMVSELRKKGIVPRRSQLIALGIHLNMVEADINNMLRLAHMPELYARDKVEALLLYILRHVDEIDPHLEYNNASRYTELSRLRLFREDYIRTIKYFQKKAAKMQEWEEGENGIDSVAEYIHERLAEMNIKEWLEEFL